MAAIKVRLLGAFAVEVDGSPVEVRGVLLRSLLAILALSAGRAISADTLSERLWERRQPAHPRATLHSMVARLRRSLGDFVVTSEQSAYRLAVEPADVDALEMLSCFAAAESEADPELRQQWLTRGLALWDEPFEDEFVDWLRQRERPRLLERYLTAIEQSVDADLQAGRFDKVSAPLQELVGRYPLRESLWSRLLLALAGSGRRAEALTLYDGIRRRLSEELGVDPGEGLQGAYQEVLTADTPGQLPVVVPDQLPADLPLFVGRVSVMAELDNLLTLAGERGGTNTTIVLHGAAGVGKTSAAVRWARRRSDQFPAGRLYVNLSGYGVRPPLDPSDALEDLLRNLGVGGSAIPASIDGRSALFRTVLANRRVLLLLDDARNADQVRSLLPGGAAFVIITSRSRLDGLATREGVRQLGVDQLTAEESRAMLSEAIRSPRSSATADLDELANLCNRLPLALAIAAAQVNRYPELGVAGLVDELRSSSARLDLLELSDDPATDLRVVLSRSYDALDPASARLFRVLGTAGARSVTAESAAALTVGGEAEAGRALRRLTDLHLIVERVRGRFELHDLLASFAVEKAEEVDPPQARRQVELRLLDWWVQAVNAARLALGGVSEPVWPLDESLDGIVPPVFVSSAAALDWLDLERRELITAVVRGAERGHHRAAAQLALLLWDYLERRSALADSLLVQQIAARCARASGDPLLEAAAANQLGTSYGRSGQVGKALRELERAQQLFREQDHEPGELLVLGNLGLALRLVGRMADSVRQFERALAIARRRGDLLTVATLSNNLAATHLALGNTDAALDRASSAIRVHEELADRRGLAYAYDTLGTVHLQRGCPAEAVAAFDDAVRIARAEDLRGPEVDMVVNLGHAWLAAGQPPKARSSWQEALDLFDRLPIGDREDAAARQTILGLLASTDSGIPSA